MKQTSMRRTAKGLCVAAGVVAATMWPGLAVAASSINGTITFDGKVPPLKPLAMDADSTSPAKASLIEPLIDESVIPHLSGRLTAIHSASDWHPVGSS